MKIVVTGGAGFIGSSLCIKLAAKYPRYSILAFDNLSRRGSELNLPDLKKAGIEFIRGDIRNPKDLATLKAFDVLIEASAEPSVLAGLDSDPSFIIDNNLIGAINCFNIWLKNKAKLIFLSTSRIYPIDKIENAAFNEKETRFEFAEHQAEKGISALGIAEDLDLNGARSFYGATKLAAEILIREYVAFYNLEAVITRLGVIAGPRQMGKTDQGVVTLWMARHFWKQALSYIGYGGMGKQVRDILHIDDLVELIDLQIHETAKFNGKIFNAGGGIKNSVSLRELTSICEKISGNKIPIAAEKQNRPADLRSFICDITRIKAETGWQPSHDVEKICFDIHEWIRQNESQLKPILN